MFGMEKTNTKKEKKKEHKKQRKKKQEFVLVTPETLYLYEMTNNIKIIGLS